MLKRLLFVTVLIILSIENPHIARAEEPVRIGNMGIFVWPEYDQPGVLVQYQGTIAGRADKDNPREIAFLVPKGAGVGAACAIKADGNHTSETWRESDAGEGFVQVTYQVDEPNFHVEYYYNPLGNAPDKKMDFVYKAIFPADEIELDIQHPLKATNFVLTPDAPDSHKDNDGFTYHVFTFKQVSAGQKLAANIAYTKSDPSPSVSKQLSSKTTSENNLTLNQVILVGTFLGAIVIAGALFLQRNARRARPIVRGEQTRADWADGFCTQCGNAMGSKDKFCSRCGSPRAD